MTGNVALGSLARNFTIPQVDLASLWTKQGAARQRRASGSGFASASSAVHWKNGRVLAAISLVAVVGCEGPQSALQPAGRDAERIASLFWIMTIGGLMVWTAVVLVAVYALGSRRQKHSQTTANLIVIGGGVALPAVVLAALLAYGMPVLSAVIAPAPEGGLVD